MSPVAMPNKSLIAVFILLKLSTKPEKSTPAMASGRTVAISLNLADMSPTKLSTAL